MTVHLVYTVWCWIVIAVCSFWVGFLCVVAWHARKYNRRKPCVVIDYKSVPPYDYGEIEARVSMLYMQQLGRGRRPTKAELAAIADEQKAKGFTVTGRLPSQPPVMHAFVQPAPGPPVRNPGPPHVGRMQGTWQQPQNLPKRPLTDDVAHVIVAHHDKDK